MIAPLAEGVEADLGVRDGLTESGRVGTGHLHVDVIADYGGGHRPDGAFSEVRNAILRGDELDSVGRLTEIPVGGFSTTETGFWIAQQALHAHHPGLVIFSNTAPRSDDVAWEGQPHQAFVYAALDTGVPVFAVNAGHNLSFVRDRITLLREVRVPNTGTQFRSRDQYAPAMMGILAGDESLLGEELDPAEIPDKPKRGIGSVDGYGNVKTTSTVSELDDKVRTSPIVRVTMKGKTHLALNTLVPGVVSRNGDLSMNRGSSGDPADPFVEFVVMLGSAAKQFGLKRMRDGRQITIEPVKY